MGKHKWRGIAVILGTIAVCWTLMGYGGATGYYNPVWVLPLYLAGLLFGVVLLVAGRRRGTE